jgi:3-hydroxyisobutyrate dehydrogenase-like beta-hydroxyacid dehydrogenase
MQAIAEAAALGERMGLDRSRMLEILAHTAVVAPAHQGKLLRATRPMPAALVEKIAHLGAFAETRRRAEYERVRIAC